MPLYARVEGDVQLGDGFFWRQWLTYLVDRFPGPEEEGFQVEGPSFLNGLVKGREPVDLSVGDILVEHEGEDRETRVDRGVAEN